jgi:hypothetical protein
MTNPTPNNRSRTFRVSFDITIIDNSDSSYANNVSSWVWDAISDNLEKGEEITAWECKEIPTPPHYNELWAHPSSNEEDDGA